LRIIGFNAAKEKLEIVSGAAPPPLRIFAGGFFRRNAFGLIQEYCTKFFHNDFDIKTAEMPVFLVDFLCEK
jgi:hypothetical protein